jgi:hypothetical protein
MYKVSVTYRYNRCRTAESDALYKSDETVQGQAEGTSEPAPTTACALRGYGTPHALDSAVGLDFEYQARRFAVHLRYQDRAEPIETSHMS